MGEFEFTGMVGHTVPVIESETGTAQDPVAGEHFILLHVRTANEDHWFRMSRDHAVTMAAQLLQVARP